MTQTTDAPASFLPDTGLPAAVVPAVNHEPRRLGALPQLLILHYTGMADAAKAVRWLACAQSRVSCHYVIDVDGAITQLVPEAARAWHAGAAHWAGIDDINSASIGIEIQNPGHEHGYPEFPPAQMEAVARLSLDIMTRNGIVARDVLAHSDVAPARKIDPGEKFDWKWLAARGVGLWVPPVAIESSDVGVGLGASGAPVDRVRAGLHRYGYGIAQTGAIDAEMAFVLRAFQLHFRPARVDGRLDRSTAATLERLLAATVSG